MGKAARSREMKWGIEIEAEGPRETMLCALGGCWRGIGSGAALGGFTKCVNGAEGSTGGGDGGWFVAIDGREDFGGVIDDFLPHGAEVFAQVIGNGFFALQDGLDHFSISDVLMADVFEEFFSGQTIDIGGHVFVVDAADDRFRDGELFGVRFGQEGQTRFTEERIKDFNGAFCVGVGFWGEHGMSLEALAQGSPG